MAREIVVRKLNHQGVEVWRYSGTVLEEREGFIRLEALFNREDLPFHGIIFGRGDRFIESFYSDRWYNIFEIHDRQDGALKGWYCNVTRPAIMEENQVSYSDLALDLLVYPDLRMLVLDEDEFSALNLDESTRQKAAAALQQLQDLFTSIRD